MSFSIFRNIDFRIFSIFFHLVTNEPVFGKNLVIGLLGQKGLINTNDFLGITLFLSF